MPNGAELIFGDKNPLTGTSGPQRERPCDDRWCNSAGVQPAWMTFTNTGAGAGGVDYTIAGGPIMGTTGITLAGTGGVGGAVYLTAPNSFSGGVAVNVGAAKSGKTRWRWGILSGVVVAYGAGRWNCKARSGRGIHSRSG